MTNTRDDKSIEERIREYSMLDKNITSAELIEISENIDKDLKFASYKRNYWRELYSSLRQLRTKIVELKRATKDVCESCHKPEGSEEVIRTLPDGKRVCKKCWNNEIDKIILLKNDKKCSFCHKPLFETSVSADTKPYMIGGRPVCRKCYFECLGDVIEE